MAITDLYIKMIAVGKSVGCLIKKDLSIYRFHDNYYVNLEVDKKKRMFGEIYVTTGHWMLRRFPELKKIGKKILSKGFATYLSSSYLKDTSSDADCSRMLMNSLSSILLWEKLQIILMIVYYRTRLLFKDFV